MTQHAARMQVGHTADMLRLGISFESIHSWHAPTAEGDLPHAVPAPDAPGVLLLSQHIPADKPGPSARLQVREGRLTCSHSMP